MKRSKNVFLNLALLMLVWCAACKPLIVNAVTDRATVGEGQTIQLASGATVRVDSIADGRCPANVQCIWQGTVTAKVTVTKASDVFMKRMTMYRNPILFDYPDSTGARLDGQTYKIILRNVTPYPVMGDKQIKLAEVQVTAI